MSTPRAARPAASGYARLAQADEEEALHPHRQGHTRRPPRDGASSSSSRYHDDDYDYDYEDDADGYDADDPFATPATVSVAAPDGAGASIAPQYGHGAAGLVGQ
ncbi:hypothetical protein KEM52_002416, partial [Ascosphaera acerosa]